MQHKTWAKYQGQTVEVINVDWGNRTFCFLQEKFPKAKVSVRDRTGQVFLVLFSELEWESND